MANLARGDRSWQLYQLKRDISNLLSYWYHPATEASSVEWLNAVRQSIRNTFGDAIDSRDVLDNVKREAIEDRRTDALSLVAIMHRNSGMSRQEWGANVPHCVTHLERFCDELEVLLNAECPRQTDAAIIENSDAHEVASPGVAQTPPREFRLQLSETDAARKYYRHLELSDKQKLRNFRKEIDDGDVFCERVSDRLCIFDARQLNPTTDTTDK